MTFMRFKCIVRDAGVTRVMSVTHAKTRVNDEHDLQVVTNLPEMLLKKFFARPLSIIARAPEIFPAFLAVTLLSRRADGRGRERFFDVGGLAGVLK